MSAFSTTETFLKITLYLLLYRMLYRSSRLNSFFILKSGLFLQRDRNSEIGYYIQTWGLPHIPKELQLFSSMKIFVDRIIKRIHRLVETSHNPLQSQKIDLWKLCSIEPEPEPELLVISNHIFLWDKIFISSFYFFA